MSEVVGSSVERAEARPAAGLTGGSPLDSLHPAIVNLRDNQEQADLDGCMVKVSRQAVDETLAITLSLIRALSWFTFDPRYDVAVGGNPAVVEQMIASAKSTYATATWPGALSSEEQSLSPNAVSASALSTDDHND